MFGYLYSCVSACYMSFICTIMCIYVHAPGCTCIFVCTFMFMCLYACVLVCRCVLVSCAQRSLCTCEHAYLCAHVHEISMCVCSCVYMCMHRCVPCSVFVFKHVYMCALICVLMLHVHIYHVWRRMHGVRVSMTSVCTHQNEHRMGLCGHAYV